MSVNREKEARDSDAKRFFVGSLKNVKRLESQLFDELSVLTDCRNRSRKYQENISFDVFDCDITVDELTMSSDLKSLFISLSKVWPYFLFFLTRRDHTLERYLALISNKVENQVADSEYFAVHFEIDTEQLYRLVRAAMNIAATLGENNLKDYSERLKQVLTVNLPKPYGVQKINNERIVIR
ncbi:hypothetical protein [Planctobacterium marinum]|uniref:hypothetical protein n=1 Tax=Planctobacterium marinum TaxID=1631968 RepID=UPI001E282A07|nr:hypothetical protein [Planctobacterium marinum]MCC2605732.1 hypothetical protein [Planctobacterium marinum]